MQNLYSPSPLFRKDMKIRSFLRFYMTGSDYNSQMTAAILIIRVSVVACRKKPLHGRIV